MNPREPRLPLVNDVGAIFDKLPPINLFRAAANATTLYPSFIRYAYRLFCPMRLDGKIERLVILYVAKLSDCDYIWRQNVVVAKALGISGAEIDALDRGDVASTTFSAAQRAAFTFTAQAVALIEVDDATFAEAARHFDSQAIVELLYVIGTYMMFARIARTGRVPLDETPASYDPKAFQNGS